jgi:hypothetical protein
MSLARIFGKFRPCVLPIYVRVLRITVRHNRSLNLGLLIRCSYFERLDLLIRFFRNISVEGNGLWRDCTPHIIKELVENA